MYNSIEKLAEKSEDLSQRAIDGLKRTREDLVPALPEAKKKRAVNLKRFPLESGQKIKSTGFEYNNGRMKYNYQIQSSRAAKAKREIKNKMNNAKNKVNETLADVKGSVNDAKKQRETLKSTKANVKAADNILNQGAHENAKAGKKAANKILAGKLKPALIGAGVLAGTGAGAYGIYRHNKNKKEKTAYDIVVEAFEKNAGFREDVKNLRTAQKAYRAVKKEKGVVNSAREQALRYAKAARDTAFEDARKSGVNAVKKRAVPIAVGAGAVGAGAGAYGIYRHNKKKKEEKTAYDIVVDAFEKMATEE